MPVAFRSTPFWLPLIAYYFSRCLPFSFSLPSHPHRRLFFASGPSFALRHFALRIGLLAFHSPFTLLNKHYACPSPFAAVPFLSLRSFADPSFRCWSRFDSVSFCIITTGRWARIFLGYSLTRFNNSTSSLLQLPTASLQGQSLFLYDYMYGPRGFADPKQHLRFTEALPSHGKAPNK